MTEKMVPKVPTGRDWRVGGDLKKGHPWVCSMHTLLKQEKIHGPLSTLPLHGFFTMQYCKVFSLPYDFNTFSFL